MSRYDDEHFLLWFTRPTPTWLELSAEARGVAISVAMVLNPKTGELPLRKGLASLARLVQIPWEKLEPALAELVAAEKLAWDGSRFVLSDPEFSDRKRKTSADRMRDKRSRDRTPSSAPPPPKPPTRDGSDARDVTGVTDEPCDARDAPSSLVLSDLVLDPDLRDAREGPVHPDATAPPPSWWAGVIETVRMSCGEALPSPGECWLRYAGHRESKAIQTERPYPASKGDAVQWITAVLVKEVRAARNEASRKRERDAKFDTDRAARRPPSPFTEPEKLTPEKQRELAEKFPMRRRDRGAE